MPFNNPHLFLSLHLSSLIFNGAMNEAISDINLLRDLPPGVSTDIRSIAQTSGEEPLIGRLSFGGRLFIVSGVAAYRFEGETVTPVALDDYSATTLIDASWRVSSLLGSSTTKKSLGALVGAGAVRDVTLFLYPPYDATSVSALRLEVDIVPVSMPWARFRVFGHALLVPRVLVKFEWLP